MASRLFLRITAPVVGVSAILLAVGVVAAWYVQRLQKNATDVLALNVSSMRAAEELEIGMREVRSRINQFLLTGDRTQLAAVPKLREETDRWLTEADRLATTEREQELMTAVKAGYEHFFEEFNRLQKPGSDFESREDLRATVEDVLTKEILKPAHEYLDSNEEIVARNSRSGQIMARRMVLALLLLGFSGPVAGLLAGFAIARGVSRSLVQLSVPVRDMAGRLNEVVGPITVSAGRDIDELEAALRRMADQIGTVVDRLQQSQRDALRSEQLAAVGQLAVGVAHELRNPLTSIKILLQSRVAREGTPVLSGRDVNVLEDEIARMERSIQAFLDFGRPPSLAKGKVVGQELVEHAMRLIGERAQQQAVRIDTELPPQPVEIEADAGQMRQVVLNLLLNALDAMPSGGSLRVSLHDGAMEKGVGSLLPERPFGCFAQKTPDPFFADRLIIRVEDTGPGLPVELGERIFEPFVSNKPAGLGMGLSITKRIVESHGGTISAENRPQGGAAFTVTLPKGTGACPSS